MGREKSCGRCPISTLCIGDSVEHTAHKNLLMCSTCREIFLKVPLVPNQVAYNMKDYDRGFSVGKKLCIPKDVCKEMRDVLDSTYYSPMFSFGSRTSTVEWTCQECVDAEVRRASEMISGAAYDHNKIKVQ